MRKIFLLLTIAPFLNFLNAQETKMDNADDFLKETIYSQNKKAVMNYSINDFDELFFEFSDKKSNESLILTKEEFYTYTIKIAIYSDRLAALYPKEKEVAAQSKKKWFAESYQDYLLSKPIQKK